MIAPILDQLAVEYQGKAKVAKLDVDSNIRTATRFNVRSIPAVLFFKNGKLVDQVIGAVPQPALEAKVKQHAAPDAVSAYAPWRQPIAALHQAWQVTPEREP